MKQELIRSVEEELESAEYKVAISRGCFDVAAAGKHSMLVKILFNIDSVTENQARSLSAASSSVDAIPIFIGLRTRKGAMEEAVYHRFGIPAVTVDALNQIVDERPLATVEKGGNVVYIDGEKMRQRRKYLGISLGSLSRETGVSKKSIMDYEYGGRARPEIARRIEEVLGSQITANKIYNILDKERTEKPKGFEATISKKFSMLGFKTMKVSGAVFNIVARNGDVILANVSEDTRRFKRNAGFLHDVSDVMGKQAVLVSKRLSKNNLEGVPVITSEDLKFVEDVEDLEDLIDERA